MSAHTPGPWSVTDTCSNYVFNVVRMGNMDFNVGSEADARLIAASPDLLAALIGLDEAFCSINEFSTKEERHDARLKLIAARAAVVKATQP